MVGCTRAGPTAQPVRVCLCTRLRARLRKQKPVSRGVVVVGARSVLLVAEQMIKDVRMDTKEVPLRAVNAVFFVRVFVKYFTEHSTSQQIGALLKGPQDTAKVRAFASSPARMSTTRSAGFHSCYSTHVSA